MYFWITFKFDEDFAITDYEDPTTYVIFFNKKKKLKEAFQKNIMNNESLKDFVKCSDDYNIFYNQQSPGVFYLLDFDYIMIVSSNDEGVTSKNQTTNIAIDLGCLSGKKNKGSSQ